MHAQISCTSRWCHRLWRGWVTSWPAKLPAHKAGPGSSAIWVLLSVTMELPIFTSGDRSSVMHLHLADLAMLEASCDTAVSVCDIRISWSVKLKPMLGLLLPTSKLNSLFFSFKTKTTSHCINVVLYVHTHTHHIYIYKILIPFINLSDKKMVRGSYLDIFLAQWYAVVRKRHRF